MTTLILVVVACVITAIITYAYAIAARPWTETKSPAILEILNGREDYEDNRCPYCHRPLSGKVIVLDDTDVQRQ